MLADFKNHQKEKNDEFLNSLPAEKRRDFVLVKLTFTSVFVPFFLAMVAGFVFDVLVPVMICEAGIALVSLVLKFPEWRRLPSKKVFLMAPLSFCLTACIAVAFSFGVGKNLRLENMKDKTEITSENAGDEPEKTENLEERFE